ncbi:hypothetical protein [Propionicimonas paludicola]|uniref:hypothetical protein n=1 Tax=Propionicimonas paludicola TaxID=185243 RepID=UPI0011799E97|nr:hypothetical protein [Propionicimonas paludicola]
MVVRDLPPMKPAKAREVVNDPSLVEYTPGGDEPRGPNTFWVSGDEVVISNENPEQPVLVTYRNGRKVRTVRTPDDGCLDLRVEGDRYWILGFEFADGAADGATTPVQDTQEYAAEYVLPKGADRLTEVKRITLPPDSGNAPVTGDLPDDYVQWDDGSLERTDTGLFAVPAGGPTIRIDGTGTVPDAPPTRSEDKTVVIKDPGFTAKIRTRIGGAEAWLMSRYGGRVFYEVDDGSGPNRGYLYEFTASGTLVHTYTLHDGYAMSPDRPIVITEDGQVYQLLISTKTARVLHIPPN